MGAEEHWHLICYDIRDPKRWAKVYKILKGRGERMQLSVFRVLADRVRLEELRWKLSKVMNEEDSLIILRLCAGCAQRVIESEGVTKWRNAPPSVEIL